MEEGRPRRPFSLPSTQYSRPHKGGREEGERGRQAASEEEVVKERQTVRANSVFETCQVEGREERGEGKVRRRRRGACLWRRGERESTWKTGELEGQGAPIWTRAFGGFGYGELP